MKKTIWSCKPTKLYTSLWDLYCSIYLLLDPIRTLLFAVFSLNTSPGPLLRWMLGLWENTACTREHAHTKCSTIDLLSAVVDQPWLALPLGWDTQSAADVLLLNCPWAPFQIPVDSWYWFKSFLPPPASSPPLSCLLLLLFLSNLCCFVSCSQRKFSDK